MASFFPGIPTEIRLGRVLGVPLFADLSLAVLLLVCVMHGGLFHGLLSALLLLASITAHELGHALAGRAFGCRTQRIVLWVLGGKAQGEVPRRAWQECLMALAGPGVSFALAGLGGCALALFTTSGGLADALGYVLDAGLRAFGLDVGLGRGLVVSPGWLETAGGVCGLSVLNLVLGLFNLLPGFPMDGGRVFRSAVRPFMSRARATYVAVVVGRGVAVLLALSCLFELNRPGAGDGLVLVSLAGLLWWKGEPYVWRALVHLLDAYRANRYVRMVHVGLVVVLAWAGFGHLSGTSCFFKLLIAGMIWTEGMREYRLVREGRA